MGKETYTALLFIISVLIIILSPIYIYGFEESGVSRTALLSMVYILGTIALTLVALMYSIIRVQKRKFSRFSQT